MDAITEANYFGGTLFLDGDHTRDSAETCQGITFQSQKQQL